MPMNIGNKNSVEGKQKKHKAEGHQPSKQVSSNSNNIKNKKSEQHSNNYTTTMEKPLVIENTPLREKNIGVTSTTGTGTSKFHPLPPKPIPFGFSTFGSNSKQRRISSKDEISSNNNNNNNNIDNKSLSSSESFREQLRHAMHRRTLTPQEHRFLERLIIDGDDIEVSLAFEKLSDSSLFFEPSASVVGGGLKSSNSKDGGDGIESNFGISKMDDEVKGGRSISGDKEERDSLHGSLGSFGSFGSEKRKQYLEDRIRSNSLHGKMWKAHENGIAVTNGASRKSIVRRNNSGSSFTNILRDIEKRDKLENLVRSSSFLSSSTQDLLIAGGPQIENEIFRTSVRSSLTSSSFSANNNNNNDNSNHHNRTLSSGTLPQFEKPMLRRLRSEEPTRKSVTFKHDTKSAYSVDVSGVTAPRRLSRHNRSKTADSFSKFSSRFTASDRESSFGSVSSIPSLHHGHPVRSDSISSIPSIHHGHPIRSDSISSIPSIHHAQTMRSDSVSSIPSLHHGRPVRSDSVTSIPYSIASTEMNFSPRSSDGGNRDDIFRKEEERFSGDIKELNLPVWSSPLTIQEHLKEEQLVEEPNPADHAEGSNSEIRKPLLLRETSTKSRGEGIEVVSEMNNEYENIPPSWDTIENARRYNSMLSVGDMSCSSFDETKSVERNISNVFRDRASRTSHADDLELSNMFLGSTRSLLMETSSMVDLAPEDDDASWTMESDHVDSTDHENYDAWDVFKDEYAVGYGVCGLPFRILGTSADDASSQPHVLSPPLMESLKEFFPFAVSEDNFWMKYSLIRDGASMYTLLQRIRGSPIAILALETSDGEVFGSFTSATWRKNWNYFGTGESFLWRMRQSRKTPCHSIIDQAHLESELDVYPWTGENNCIQLCTHDRIAVGGGIPATKEGRDDTNKGGNGDYGFGLAIDSDLLYGTSNSCVTFSSPPLSLSHPDGSKFEIINLEVWTLTPCMSIEEAEKLELSMLFLQSHASATGSENEYVNLK